MVRLVSADCNHNTHYHRILLRFLPARGEAALDVGSGDGAFAALLSRRYAEVVAIDAGPVQVAAVRARCGALPHVAVRQADLLDSGLPDGYFDAVTALAVLHHMPFADAAGEVKRLLKPRGRLVVLGVWTDHGARPGA